MRRPIAILALFASLVTGNPVIAHDNPYNRWVAGDEARFFSGTSDLEKVLDDVMGDPVTQRRMGEASRRRHATEFTWEHVASQYEELLAQVVIYRSDDYSELAAARAEARADRAVARQVHGERVIPVGVERTARIEPRAHVDDDRSFVGGRVEGRSSDLDLARCVRLVP